MKQYNYMRDDRTDEYGILALQNKILEIMVYIDELCRKYNISYFLMGGSALGSVRHGGFIPWDDDLDIFMRPDDCKKFVTLFDEIGDKKRFYLQKIMKRGDLVLSLKLRMNNTAYIEKATRDWNIHQGIFVDIFILHNCPNSILMQAWQCIAAKYLLAHGQAYKNVSYKGIRKLMTALVKLLPRDFGVKQAMRALHRYDRSNVDYYCHFAGKAFFRKGIYDKDIFSSSKRVAFEKVEFDIPWKVEEYLHKRFGDYMVVPTKDSIKATQHVMIWNTSMDFCRFVPSADQNYSDEWKLS